MNFFPVLLSTAVPAMFLALTASLLMVAGCLVYRSSHERRKADRRVLRLWVAFLGLPAVACALQACGYLWPDADLVSVTIGAQAVAVLVDFPIALWTVGETVADARRNVHATPAPIAAILAGRAEAARFVQQADRARLLKEHARREAVRALSGMAGHGG